MVIKSLSPSNQAVAAIAPVLKGFQFSPTAKIIASDCCPSKDTTESYGEDSLSDTFRQHLNPSLVAIISVGQVSASLDIDIHYATPDGKAHLHHAINSHSVRCWLKTLIPFQVAKLRNIKPIDKSIPCNLWHIYSCQFHHHCSQDNTSSLIVCCKDELSPLQQFCIEQRARYLYQLKQRQQQQEQMRCRALFLEDIIRKIGHQLRTPLASIELYAEILATNLTSSESQAQVQPIQQLARKLTVTLKQLTSGDLTTSVKHSFRRHNLQTIAWESINELQPQLDQKKILLVGERASYEFAVDPWQIQQVFSNLLSNAIAFSAENDMINFRWQGFQNEVLIEISDQGPGFSAEDLRNLFTSYYSRRPGGQGLGIAIAKQIVLDHDGTIKVSNRPQGGAQISITLPRRC